MIILTSPLLSLFDGICQMRYATIANYKYVLPCNKSPLFTIYMVETFGNMFASFRH